MPTARWRWPLKNLIQNIRSIVNNLSDFTEKNFGMFADGIEFERFV